MREIVKDGFPEAGSIPTESVAASCKGPARWHNVTTWLLPSLGGILFSTVLLGVLLLGQSHILGSSGDIALHLRLGSDMLTKGGLVTTNTLTSVAYGQPAIAWEWLSELVFAGAWQLFGLNGVVAMTSLIIAITSILLFQAVHRRSVPLLIAFPLTLAAIALTSTQWLAGPHIFSLLLTLWWSEQLWSYWQSDNPRKLWPFPFMLALWANLDGGYIAGVILLTTATVLAWLFPNAASTRSIDARRWQLTLILAVSLLATLLIPLGVGELPHLFSFFSSGVMLYYFSGSSPLDFRQPNGLLFLAMLLLLAASGILRGWLMGGRAAHSANVDVQDEQRRLALLAAREPGALSWALVGVFTAIALISAAALPLWGVAVTPIMGRELASWTAEWAVADMNGHLACFCRALFRHSGKLEHIDKRLHAGLWSILAVVFMFVLLLDGGTLPGSASPLLSTRFSPETFPVEAVQTIQHGVIPGNTLPNGTGFTTIAWADYIEWTLPHHLVMIDSRTELFDDSVLGDYQTLLNGEPGWNQIITTYNIRWLLIPTAVPLAQIIVLAQSWLCQQVDTHHIALLCLPAPALPVT